jgi:cell division septum initiation protein DivIVA
MGVERAVTRWYVQRQALLEEIASLEAQLASAASNAPGTGALSAQESADRQLQLARAREKLRTLGSCPKPMMG